MQLTVLSVPCNVVLLGLVVSLLFECLVLLKLFPISMTGEYVPFVTCMLWIVSDASLRLVVRVTVLPPRSRDADTCLLTARAFITTQKSRL